MPKNNKQLNKVVIRGTSLYSLTATTTDSQGLIPSNTTLFGTRLPLIADTYTYFRFVSLVLEIKPNSSQQIGVGYLPSYELTAANTVALTQEYDHRALQQPGQSIPEYLRLNRQQLCGEGLNNWWKTVVDASVQGLDENQGQIDVVLSSSGAASIIMHYVCEFSGLVPGAVNPLLRKQKITDGGVDPSSLSVSDSKSSDPMKAAYELIRLHMEREKST